MLRFLTDLFRPKAPSAPPITSETSMNFDIADVGPFLTVLANHPRFGLPAELQEVILRDLPDLAVDSTRRWTIDGDFDGAPVTIQIEVFMDDVDAPDLSFFSTQDVIDEIDAELVAFAEAMER